jgi:hypothetical protein
VEEEYLTAVLRVRNCDCRSRARDAVAGILRATGLKRGKKGRCWPAKSQERDKEVQWRDGQEPETEASRNCKTRIRFEARELQGNSSPTSAYHVIPFQHHFVGIIKHLAFLPMNSFRLLDCTVLPIVALRTSLLKNLYVLFANLELIPNQKSSGLLRLQVLATLDSTLNSSSARPLIGSKLKCLFLRTQLFRYCSLREIKVRIHSNSSYCRLNHGIEHLESENSPHYSLQQTRSSERNVISSSVATSGTLILQLSFVD